SSCAAHLHARGSRRGLVPSPRFPPLRMLRTLLPGLVCLALLPAAAAAQQAAPYDILPGERVVFIGNTFAERMQLFPHFEALLTSRQPDRRLSFRYLAWSGDEVALRPRPLNFGDLHTHLREQEADVIFAAFGMNESYRGESGLAPFAAQLGALLDSLRTQQYNGSTPARVVLLSPIPHEAVSRVPLDPRQHNADLARYTATMRSVAAEKGVAFVDLFNPMRPLLDDPALGD